MIGTVWTLKDQAREIVRDAVDNGEIKREDAPRFLLSVLRWLREREESKRLVRREW